MENEIEKEVREWKSFNTFFHFLFFSKEKIHVKHGILFCDFSSFEWHIVPYSPSFGIWMGVHFNTVNSFHFISFRYIHSLFSLYIYCLGHQYLLPFSSVNLFTMFAYNPKSFLSNVFIHFYCFIFHVRVVVRGCICVRTNNG